MNSSHGKKIMKNVKSLFSVFALAAVIGFSFASCGDGAGGGTGPTGTVTIGMGGSSRSAWQPSDENGTYKITLEGPTGTQHHTLGKGVTTASYTLESGIWKITVEACYKEKLYAKGSDTVNVTTGRNNPVIIQMIENIVPAGFIGIYTQEDLENIYNSTDHDVLLANLAKNYFLVYDITLTGEWTPIGNDDYPFIGAFDGNGNKIKCLSINEDMSYVGLFGYIGTNGKVRNLGIECDITGSANVGGVVGFNTGTVENCYSTGKVTGEDFSGTGTGTEVGGVVGYNEGIVQNCYSASIVSGESNVGGVVGTNVNNTMIVGSGTVENCYSTGTVNGTGSYTYIGGVVGYNEGTVQNCYSTGDVINGRMYSSGGVAGSNNDIIQNCVALNASVSGSMMLGRVMGIGSTTGLANNYARSTLGDDWSSPPFNKGVTTEDGADVDAETYSAQSFWQNTLEWDFDDVWKWDSSKKLPVLR